MKMKRLILFESTVDSSSPWSNMSKGDRLKRATILLVDVLIFGGLLTWLLYRETNDLVALGIGGGLTLYIGSFFVSLMIAPQGAVKRHLRITRYLGVLVLIGWALFLVALALSKP